jgi:lipoyl(octanoyl) transferase
VLAPAALLGGPREAYQTINRALVDGLRRLGVPAGVAGTGSIPDPRLDAAAPCFHAPAAGEVVAAGRKLVGSAQRCEGGALLQHGSILLGGSQQAVLHLMRGPVAGGSASASPGSVTLAELCGAVPSWADLAAALAAGFRDVCGTRLAPDGLTREEAAGAGALERVFGDAAWTWRR